MIHPSFVLQNHEENQFFIMSKHDGLGNIEPTRNHSLPKYAHM